MPAYHTNEWGLTDKQEAFVAEYLTNGNNATAAYEKCIALDGTSRQHMSEAASRMIKSFKIRSRIAYLRGEIGDITKTTVESVLMELEEARVLAVETAQPGAAATASIAKSKIMGFEKTNLVLQDPEGKSPFPKKIEIVSKATKKRKPKE